MNRFVMVAFGVALLAGSAQAKPAQEHFTVPEGWKLMPGPDSGVVAYQTAERKEDSLIVVLRPIKAPGQTPQRWAEDEVAAIERQGFKLVEPPAQMTAGSASFIKMASWNDLAGFGLRNEQYFCVHPDKEGILEAAILGPEQFFESQRGSIQELLASLR